MQCISLQRADTAYTDDNLQQENIILKQAKSENSSPSHDRR